jgi:hypothetical protein
MRSPWPVRVLLPAAHALAEGSWLAVLYAALQAVGGEKPYVSPIELGALALAGTAWSRRRRWTSPTPEALGLPLLALLAGMFGWLLDPDVRLSLVQGNLLVALTMHTPGWLAALAFWRGDAHRVRGDDAYEQDRLMRWAVPALVIPWLVGYAATSGQLQQDFAAAAFLGTILFSGSGFTALGLRRLEAVRLSTGSDWRGNRSWLFMIVGLAIALTVIAVPLAALLGIPGRSLLGIMVGPLQTLILLMVLLTAPIFILAAIIAGLLKALLVPQGFQLELSLPSFNLAGAEGGSDLPAIILTVLVGAIFLFDLAALLFLVWMGLKERLQMEDPSDPAFEERSIVVPPPTRSERAPATAARPRATGHEDDVTGAYLAALDALAADGRWPRRAHETPAAHLSRARAGGLEVPSFGRLTAAYQLARYGGQPLADRERTRAQGRLRILRAWLSGP